MDPFQQGLASGSAELRSMDSPFWVLRGFGETGGPRQSLMYGTPVGCCFFGTKNCLFSAQKNQLVPKKNNKSPGFRFHTHQKSCRRYFVAAISASASASVAEIPKFTAKIRSFSAADHFSSEKNRSRSKFSSSQVNMIGLLMVVVAGF